MFLKQMFCNQHEWEVKRHRDFHLYCCRKCGKTKWFGPDLKEFIWLHKRRIKGDSFINIRYSYYDIEDKT